MKAVLTAAILSAVLIHTAIAQTPKAETKLIQSQFSGHPMAGRTNALPPAESARTFTVPDDPQFNTKPYAGKLMKFAEVPGKELTLTCRYADEMNEGGYELVFSKDLKKVTGVYIIDGEEASDANTVEMEKQ